MNDKEESRESMLSAQLDDDDLMAEQLLMGYLNPKFDSFVNI